MTALKPCPFCGADGDDLLCIYLNYEDEDMRNIRYLMPYDPDVLKEKDDIMVSKIHCSMCGSQMYCIGGPEQLLENWNRRVKE